jgi:class 3 adenylate cyclase
MPNTIFNDILYYFLWLEREAAATAQRDFWIIIPLTGALVIFAALTLIVITKSRKTAAAFAEQNNALSAKPVPVKKKQSANVKTATILSGRLLSLNHLFENESHEQMALLLNRYLKAARYATEKTNGTCYHTVDGSIVADWGLMSTTGNAAHDALNAVRSALILRMNLFEGNKTLFIDGERPLKSLCGISTGKMTAVMSRKKNAAPCIIGGSTLLAARAREAAEKNGIDIVITAKTWRLVEQYIIAEEIEALRGENGTAIRLFAVINLRAKNEAEQPRPTNLKELQSLIQTGGF